MKKKFRILKILVTVILFGFLLSFSLKRFNEKPLDKISVNLTQTRTPVYFIDEKDIRGIVKKMNPTKKIGDVNIPELEKKLNALPAVDSANVYLNLNGTLNLDIRQRVPAFRLNREGGDVYVDFKGTEFPLSDDYSFPCMLVSGAVPKTDYLQLAELITKIENDAFSKKYFIGITREKGGYSLLTGDGNYKVEIGDLDRIDFKVRGFKTFVEKYLVYQQPEKYSRISVKYDNQIVTTLNPNFADNDSLIKVGNRELAKQPELIRKKTEAVQTATIVKPAPVKKAQVKKPDIKKEKKPAEKPKPVTKTKTPEKKKEPAPAAKTPAKVVTKPKGKVKIE